jgi:hypothetical protein
MRVAVVLYGQPRDYLNGFRKISEFCKKQQNVRFDIFYHCWTLNEGDEYEVSPWGPSDRAKNCFGEKTKEDLAQLYNPVMYEYETKKTFDSSEYQNTIAFKNTKGKQLDNIHNVLSQLYSRNKARNLLNKYIVDTNTYYDFVLMTRFDIRVMPQILFANLDKSKIFVSHMHLPRKIIPDNCIITPTHIFLEWFDIYEKLNIILDSTHLLKNVESLGEGLIMNTEELILTKYILHNKNTDNICYFRGGVY